MASTGSVYSQTLQDITTTKLTELAKRRETFERYRKRVLALSEKAASDPQALVTISDIVKACFAVTVVDGKVSTSYRPPNRLEIDLQNIDRFLAQAQYDPTISVKNLEQWERTLVRHVDVQSLKFTYAWLYGQLTTEWLGSKGAQANAKDEDTEMADFEKVSSAKKLESRRNWEESVFSALPVDEGKIKSMLRGLFEASPDDSQALPATMKALRENVATFEREMSSSKITQSTLQWAIKGLLSSDLLTNDKREALRDFQKNPTILNEIVDVLNMRLAALEEWSWGKEVILEERRQLNGTYHIFMHEDLLQALFLQHIGVKWSVFWKTSFMQFQRDQEIWKAPGKKITSQDLKRREYFLGSAAKKPSVISKKQKLYRDGYLVSQLLSSEHQETESAEGEEEADIAALAVTAQQVQAHQQGASVFASAAPPTRRTKQTARISMAQAAPRMMAARKSAPSTAGVQRPPTRFLREVDYADEEAEESDDDNDDDDASKSRNPMAMKQALLHLLSVDIMIQTKLNGEIAAFRSQFDNLYPSLPHATIKAVLSFFGVSKRWLDFFTRFLQAPLRFADEPSAEPRLRKTGTPGSHVLSEVFAELVLFCLDFLINQSTEGEMLWRMHDDFWFWTSDNDKAVRAWGTVNDFVQTMGLSLSAVKSGAVRIKGAPESAAGVEAAEVSSKLPQGQIRWGMLYLNPESGRFEIDQAMVDEHIEELSRQLKDKGSSVFAWIAVFNSYASTFFTSNFGKPANCFGRQHVDNMLATHGRIQKQVFAAEEESGGFVGHLKRVIASRHGVDDLPDGYFYFPTELGGLEVHSPFIDLLQVRDAVLIDSSKLFKDFHIAEKEAYREAKREFEDGRVGRNNNAFKSSFVPKDAETFMSFEEFAKYREEVNYDFGNCLLSVFEKLLEPPAQQSIETDNNSAVFSAAREANVPGKLASWNVMKPYWKWVAQLYGPEMVERFSSFKIVDPGLLPIGLSGLLRSGKVNWQE